MSGVMPMQSPELLEFSATAPHVQPSKWSANASTAIANDVSSECSSEMIANGFLSSDLFL
jgi:hypothetical protein